MKEQDITHHPARTSHGTVAILMCTFRGEKHLRRQLETIFAQSYRDWTLYVSDDGSDDETLAILEEFRVRSGGRQFRVFAGPRRGFASNFFSLIARKQVRGLYYAFTDQDDEWDVDKLLRAVTRLKCMPPDAPVLYGSRAEIVDEHGAHLGYSKRFRRPSSFANALVQNMVSGNTMVLNDGALELIRNAGTDLDVSAHDWWAYLLVTGSGGLMIYDHYPTIRYRQHDRNLYGSNVSWRAMLTRIKRMFAGDFREWNDRNMVALRAISSLLHEDNRRLIELFDQARRGSRARRLLGLYQAGVYRQTLVGQLGLAVAAVADRL
jgi:glycosyltransferase involved in cell wall biosynthesis